MRDGGDLSWSYPSIPCASNQACRAQQYPSMLPRAAVSGHATRKYPSMLHAAVSEHAAHNLSWPLPSPCRLRANHHRVSEHAARNNISEHAARKSTRACRTQKYPGMPRAAVSGHAACRTQQYPSMPCTQPIPALAQPAPAGCTHRSPPSIRVSLC